MGLFFLRENGLWYFGKSASGFVWFFLIAHSSTYPSPIHLLTHQPKLPSLPLPICLAYQGAKEEVVQILGVRLNMYIRIVL